ncbi:MAG: hypothetical protein M1837_002694 [Sclerophora amabilis]|nr:MAG: hypothetical protein M1837_002694 [Sclerophora amabilis]
MGAPKLLLLGASGYIGGHALGLLISKHPEYEITALVRNQSQAEAVSTRWNTVKTVIGDLDSQETLVRESGKADVVLNLANADHAGAVRSILQGLKGTSGRLIHTSGTAILHDVPNNYGEPSSKIFHDIDDIKDILSLDQSQPHRDIDIAVIDGGKEHGVSTLIVAPPTIYGEGAGPVKRRSTQIPLLLHAWLKRGNAFMVGKGANFWGNVHVDDLAEAYVLLTEEALKPNGGNATWGPEGYYFVENGEHTWGEVISAVAESAHQRGLVSSSKVDQVSKDEAEGLQPFGSILWGGNSRCRAQRLPALGWKPSAPSIFDTIDSTVAATERAG